jgi:type IV pilus assembly protein PilC
MPEFKYIAKDAAGKKMTGSLTAVNESDAVGQLRQQGLIVVTLDAQAKAKGPGLGIFGKGGKAPKPRIKSKDIVVFTRQMATMISAGIPLLEALEILQEQAEDPGFKYSLGNIVEMVRSGSDLSEAMGKHPRVFANIYVNMIRAGEASGQLDEILNRLADYQEASEKLKAEIKSAMTYPVVSLALIFGILMFLLIVIIPKFEAIFKSLGKGVELPLPTKILINISNFMQTSYYIWIPGAIILVIAIIMFKKTERGGWFFDRLKLRLPIFGILFKKVAISRFAKTFATLIKSGVPILAALDIVAATSGNRVLEKAIREASESVRQGETLGAPLSKCEVFPPMVTRMITIGEKSGSLESLLEKISEFYDNDVSTTVDSLTSLIEPIMISVMGLMVGGIVLAVFMPIFQFATSVKKKG